MIVIMMTYNSYLEVLLVALPKTYLETFITLTEGFTVRAKSCAILKRDPPTSGGNIPGVSTWLFVVLYTVYARTFLFSGII